MLAITAKRRQFAVFIARGLKRNDLTKKTDLCFNSFNFSINYKIYLKGQQSLRTKEPFEPDFYAKENTGSCLCLRSLIGEIFLRSTF